MKMNIGRFVKQVFKWRWEQSTCEIYGSVYIRILWPAGQKYPKSWRFVAHGKEQILNEVPIFCVGPASCLTRRAWHMQLWLMDQSGYVHLAR